MNEIQIPTCKVDNCTHELAEEQSFQDKNLRKYIEKILTKKEEIITEDLSPRNNGSIKTEYFNKLVFKGEFDWIQNKWILLLMISVFFSNIISNYFLYRNYLTIDDDTLKFNKYLNDFFPVLIIIIFISISFLYFLLIQFESYKLVKIIKYLAVAELFSIFGTAANMFWAAIAVWCAFLVLFLVNIDITWIRPSRQMQIALIIEEAGPIEQPKKKKKDKSGGNTKKKPKKKHGGKK